MLVTSAPESVSTIALIEGSLTAILVGVAFIAPRIGSAVFPRIERPFAQFAKRRGLAVAVVGLATLLIRLAILPIFHVPLPFSPDDFSFLLAADTFAHGHLTNPTPAMWTHFESIHITMLPTYMTMYFPAQGLVLAAGKVLFGSPWAGILITSALMCAAICWMLQAWLPPSWALLGGLIAIVHLGLFSYWINTYTGGGTPAALAGALVMGALPRLIRTGKFRYGMLLAVGIGLGAISRPYESMLLCLPAAVWLGHWALFGKNRPRPAVLVRRAILPLIIIIAAVAWLGYYDYKAFGSPTTLPYTVSRATYARAPYFVWQSLRPMPAYRYQSMRDFYYLAETRIFEKIHTVDGFIPQTLQKVWFAFQFFAGFALLPPLIMLRRVFLDRRIRILILCAFVLAAGMLIQIFIVPHYLAPFTAVFYAIGLQAMRHLRQWRPEGKPVGLAMLRMTVTLCFVLAGVRLLADPLRLAPTEWPPYDWLANWYGPGNFGGERAQIETNLEQLPGQQLVIVRYSPKHYYFEQWVYNSDDLNNSKVLGANDMDANDNLELIRYYPGRKVWLVEPDTEPAKVSPYPVPTQ
jgi:hypothetical protein